MYVYNGNTFKSTVEYTSCNISRYLQEILPAYHHWVITWIYIFVFISYYFISIIVINSRSRRSITTYNYSNSIWMPKRLLKYWHFFSVILPPSFELLWPFLRTSSLRLFLGQSDCSFLVFEVRVACVGFRASCVWSCASSVTTWETAKESKRYTRHRSQKATDEYKENGE